MPSPLPPPDDSRRHEAAERPNQPLRTFASAKAWAAWLEKNHAKSSGLWLRLMKKDSGVRSVTYAEAVEEALCHGWIDGQKRSYDEGSWLQKFCPRGKKSLWSKVNREKVAALIRAERMKPAGHRVVEAARADGRWDAAYDSQKTAVVPEDFQALLAKHPKAAAFFATLKSASRYAILFRLQTAKRAETRVRKMSDFIAMLKRGEAPYLIKPKS